MTARVRRIRITGSAGGIDPAKVELLRAELGRLGCTAAAAGIPTVTKGQRAEAIALYLNEGPCAIHHNRETGRLTVYAELEGIDVQRLKSALLALGMVDPTIIEDEAP